MKKHTSTKRIFQLLEVLSKYKSVSVDKLVEDTDIPYTTIYRILQTSVHLGYVDFTKNHNYRLSQKLFHIASTYLHAHCPLSIIAHPFLQKLYYHVKETIHLGILEGNQVLYVDKIDSKHKIRMHSHIGYQAEIHCTALGKIIANYLDEPAQKELIENSTFTTYTPRTISSKKEFKDELKKIRELGFAEDNEENESYLYCMAVPIFDVHNQIAGAISLSMLTFRFKQNQKTHLLQALFESAKEISKQLGNQQYQKCLGINLF